MNHTSHLGRARQTSPNLLKTHILPASAWFRSTQLEAPSTPPNGSATRNPIHHGCQCVHCNFCHSAAHSSPGPILGLVSLIILAGGILLQFFTILSGGVNSSPENQFYFLQASTSGIPNARNPSRWTFFAICGVDATSGHNANCGSSVPALPFDPPRNFGTDVNVPSQFIGYAGLYSSRALWLMNDRTHHYYYLSRFMFAFYLIALFLAVVALFTGLLALCSRLGGYLAALTTATALFFQILAASLMT